MISSEKMRALHERLERVGVREEDLVEKFVLGSGRGGQKVNKTSSAVYLKHVPSGLEVKCQEDRSRELNRYRARVRLVEMLEKKVFKEKSAKERLEAKIKRQKRRRSRRSKAQSVEEKRQRSETKKFRKSADEI